MCGIYLRPPARDRPFFRLPPRVGGGGGEVWSTIRAPAPGPWSLSLGQPGPAPRPWSVRDVWTWLYVCHGQNAKYHIKFYIYLHYTTKSELFRKYERNKNKIWLRSIIYLPFWPSDRRHRRQRESLRGRCRRCLCPCTAHRRPCLVSVRRLRGQSFGHSSRGR